MIKNPFTDGERVFLRARQQWATFIGSDTPNVSCVVFDGEEKIAFIDTDRLEPAELCCTSDMPACGQCIQLYPTELNAHRFVPQTSPNPPGIEGSIGLAGKYSEFEAGPVEWPQVDSR